MPKKTDGIPFTLQPRPTKGDDGKPLLYAQPVIEHKYTIDDIDRFCTEYRHTSSGEVKHMFSLLSEITSLWLSKGYRVETPYGTLAPKLKLTGEHTDPGKVRGRDVLYGGVEFIPYKQFVNDSDCSRSSFRLVSTSVGNSQKNDPKAMEEALQKSLRHGYITIKNFAYHSGLKRDSAQDYLDSLCTGDHPRLRRYREGRVWHYTFLETSPTV